MKSRLRETSGKHETSGSKAAAIISAAIGAAIFGFSSFLFDGGSQNGNSQNGNSQISEALGKLVDPESLPLSKAGLSAGGWLGSWGILYIKWKRKRKRIKKIIFIVAILLILAFTGVLPIFN